MSSTPHLIPTSSDILLRSKFVERVIISQPQKTSQDELAIFESAKANLELATLKFEKISDDQRFPKEASVVGVVGVGTGRCTGTIQTSPEDLIAWLTLETDQSRQEHESKGCTDSNKYPMKKYEVNDHHSIYYICRPSPRPLATRDWLFRVIWNKVDEDNYNVYYYSIETGPKGFAKTTLENVVRGQVSRIDNLKRLPHNQCLFTVNAKYDVKVCVRNTKHLLETPSH